MLEKSSTHKEKCYANVINLQEINMARTKRRVCYRHYWGDTKQEAKIRWEEEVASPYKWGSIDWERQLERDYLLHGTDTKNHSYSTHEYFNRVNRIGRRVARDQLRPHIVLSEDFDFDDSHYRARYKGVWWDIY
jgi:hypothetical protein